MNLIVKSNLKKQFLNDNFWRKSSFERNLTVESYVAQTEIFIQLPSTKS